MGFVIRHRGIEISLSKVREIQDMPPSRNLKELRGLQGCLAYIRRFISSLAGCYRPFSYLMKKGAPFEWDDSCQKAFDSIKRYLLSPPVLRARVPSKPLLLHIAVQKHSLGHYMPRETQKEGEMTFTT